MLKMSAVETLYSDQFKLSKTKLTSPPQKITSDKFITYKIKKISSWQIPKGNEKKSFKPTYLG